MYTKKELTTRSKLSALRALQKDRRTDAIENCTMPSLWLVTIEDMAISAAFPLECAHPDFNHETHTAPVYQNLNKNGERVAELFTI